MTEPVPVPVPPVYSQGMIVELPARVLSVDDALQTCIVRVIDNNGAVLSGQLTIPHGVMTPKEFPIVIGDVLEKADAGRRTAVVRWVSADGQQWAESPLGEPTRTTVGWKKIGNVVIP